MFQRVYNEVWRSCGKEQASHHIGSERVPAGAQKELQPPEREPEADVRKKDS